MICAACGHVRRPADLLAFWPVGQPGRRRFVCRPSVPTPAAGPCFTNIVGSAAVHAIAFAEAPARPAGDARPVLPRTDAWRSLLLQAGVRTDQVRA